jgi:hypothetical protein
LASALPLLPAAAVTAALAAAALAEGVLRPAGDGDRASLYAAAVILALRALVRVAGAMLPLARSCVCLRVCLYRSDRERMSDRLNCSEQKKTANNQRMI